MRSWKSGSPNSRETKRAPSCRPALAPTGAKLSLVPADPTRIPTAIQDRPVVSGPNEVQQIAVHLLHVGEEQAVRRALVPFSTAPLIPAAVGRPVARAARMRLCHRAG